MPAALLDQLKDGGRLVAIRIESSTGTSAVGRATIWTRTGMHTDARPAFDTAALILPGFERKYEFSL
jgi:protein-L-isoaspartate(D-aspartate) O-methyltransferase